MCRTCRSGQSDQASAELPAVDRSAPWAAAPRDSTSAGEERDIGLEEKKEANRCSVLWGF